MSCRTGLLRGERVLTHLFTGFALALPMVGIKFHADPGTKALVGGGLFS